MPTKKTTSPPKTPRNPPAKKDPPVPATTKKVVEEKLDPKAVIAIEVKRLATKHGIPESILEEFARFVERTANPPAPLPIKEIQQRIYQHFDVTNATQLKASGSFKLASSGMGKLSLSNLADCQRLYRRFIGILPNEEGEVGYGCINGINIFKYDLPWRTFGLDPETAKDSDIKRAYYDLSKIYHPDNQETGDERIFNKINIFYKSLTEKFEQWL